MKKIADITENELNLCKEISLDYEVQFAHVVDIYRRCNDIKQTKSVLIKEEIFSFLKDVIVLIQISFKNLLVFAFGGAGLLFMCYSFISLFLYMYMYS